MRRWLLPVLILTAGCAGRPGSPPASDAAPGEAAVVERRDVDLSGLRRAEEALTAGQQADAVWAADSLVLAWSPASALEASTARRLAALYASVGEDVRACAVLLASARSDGRTLSQLRESAGRLSVSELQSLAQATEASGPSQAVIWAELARALALAGRSEEAAAAAGRVPSGASADEDVRTAEDVLSSRMVAPESPLRIGLILPGTGRFAAVGGQLLEGALLAVAEHRRNATNPPIQLEVLDDSSRVELAAPLLRELEERGVMAVVGPVRSEALWEAARARREPGLLVLSPTASDDADLPLHSYTLWNRERRERRTAERLAAWLSENLGVTRYGVLYPESSDSAATAAFAAAVEQRRGTVVGAFSYPADSTTFEGPIASLSALDPEAVFVLADNARTVLQIGPQLVYYGLRSKIIAGGAAWSDPVVVRRLDPSYADYRVVATYLDRLNPGTGWARFQIEYEREYRKPLPDNMFVALGYDAMALILRHLPADRLPRPGGVARAIQTLRGYEAASGTLSFDRRTGTLERGVAVRMLLGGQLREPDAAAILAWAEETRQLEEYLKSLDEEKEKAKAETDAERRRGRVEGSSSGTETRARTDGMEP